MTEQTPDPSTATIADDAPVYVLAIKEGIRLGVRVHGAYVEVKLTTDAARALQQDLRRAERLYREYQAIL
jgi:hypothetical protein